MGYIKFDRHANMSVETLREIGDIIGEVDFNTGFDLMNMLYGLYDGFLYDDLLEVARGAKINKALYNRIKNVVSVIKNYKL
jgi:hypothetical protein